MNWEIHIQKIRTWLAGAYTEKYTSGVRKHGGGLWKKPVLWTLRELLNELLDAISYFYVLATKVDRVVKLLQEIEHSSDPEKMRVNIRRALNALTREDKD